MNPFNHHSVSKNLSHTHLSTNIYEEIFMDWRRKHSLKENDHGACDLKTVLFFETSCSLAEFGYNTDYLNRR